MCIWHAEVFMNQTNQFDDTMNMNILLSIGTLSYADIEKHKIRGNSPP